MILTTISRIHKSTGYIQRKISRQIGTNIVSNDDDWDIMIIADAASYEITKELATEYEYMTSVDSIWSRGSYSPEWAQNTFIEDNVRTDNIDYVNGNPLTALVCGGIHEKNMFGSGENITDELLSQYTGVDIFNNHYEVWNSDSSSITTRALDVMSENPMMIHYMKPHSPFVGDIKYWPTESKDAKAVNSENYSQLIDSYRESHRHIFSKLKELLANLDNDLNVRITADHGNMYGEILNQTYALGHPEYVWLSRNLRKVPYITVDQSSVTDREIQTESESETINNRLDSLGYL
jgi:hypothetical protein